MSATSQQGKTKALAAVALLGYQTSGDVSSAITAAQPVLGSTTFNGVALTTAYVITHGLAFTPSRV